MILLKTIIGVLITLYLILGIPATIYCMWVTLKDDIKHDIMTIPLFIAIMLVVTILLLPIMGQLK